MAEVTKYQHIFFDLDHTLWDFHTNSNLALAELFVKYELAERLGTTIEVFRETYIRINDEMWDKYRNGKVDKKTLRSERFKQALLAFNHDDSSLGATLDTEYLEISPRQTALIPDTIEVLEYLAPKYELHILTNGFSQVQDIKLTQSGLKPYFRQVITSESIGVNKPHAPIFQESFRRTGATCDNSVMIGDNLEADIIGARNCGMDQVYFNPEGTLHEEDVTFEIRQLKELLTFL